MELWNSAIARPSSQRGNPAAATAWHRGSAPCGPRSGYCAGSIAIAGSPNWEGTGKIFCLREDLRQELRRFQGRAPAWLLGAW
eukprot:scaffold22748_cov120-Isochrysis_galbana.AAC.2